VAASTWMLPGVPVMWKNSLFWTAFNGGSDRRRFGFCSLLWRDRWRNRLVCTGYLEVVVSFAKEIKTVATDSHFLVPLCVLVLGIALLAILH
jgi:hypothetical protein